MSDQGDTPQAAGGVNEERVTEARPRRVTLRRDENGSYSIFMRRRMIQGFCSEFEDITSFHIEPDTQVQVRINIQQLGGVHRATYPEREPDGPEIVRVRATREDGQEQEIGLFSSAHPQGIETWQDQARRAMQEQMTRLQDMLNLLESM